MEQIGRYQVVGELGRGAMGVVYRAQDPAIGRTVAIKTIRLSELTDPSERERLRERLFREAQSAGVLSHPGIVTIYDIQESGDLAYVFMEFVDGASLDKLLSSDTPPDKEALFDILRQTAAALDYAHKKGVVHRDIKPANIMIHQDEATGHRLAKVTDFGVARIVSQQRTQSGMIMGTPNYMSPEQIQGQPVDGRADQFALAVIAYELLTGEKPFAADSLATVLFRIVTEEPTAPQRLNQTLGFAVADVLGKGLTKDPAARYENCVEFIAALDTALAACPDWVMLPAGAGLNMPTVAATTVTVVRPAPKRIEKPVAAVPPDPALEERTVTMPVPLPATVPAPPVETVSPPPQAAAPPPPPPPPPRREPIELPPARQPRHAATDPAPSRARRAAVLVAIGLLGFATAGGAIWWFTMRPQEAPPAAAEVKPEAAPEVKAEPRPAEPPPVTPPPTPASTDAPASPPPAKPKPAAEAKPPAPLTGQFDIEFYSSPSGAVVVVDGRTDLTCKTPCGLPLYPGRHALAASLAGYRQAMKILEVPRDRSVAVGLLPMTGTVMVKSNPSGASIHVDGREWTSRTPAVLTLPVGRHKIEFFLDGYQKEEQTVEVKDGVMTNLDINWTRNQ